MTQRFVIIGAGHAGAAAAQELARAVASGALEAEIALVDADAGLPYERPALSKEWLTAETFPEAAPHDWAAAGIAFHGGRHAERIDAGAREVALADGTRLGYDRLLLAPGGTPRRLPVPGGEACHVLRTAADSRLLHAALRKGGHLAVIGAGVIGLETASSARKLGLEVTVIEAGDRVMARSLPPEISALLQARHEAAGVQFLFGAAITGIATRADGRQVVSLKDGSVLAADLMVAGIGFDADTALAATAGLKLDRGILVDADGQSSVPGIFAAGDATVFPGPSGAPQCWQTWQHARRHGAHVARRMAGLASDYAPVHWFWTDQQGLNLQVLGDPLGADDCVLRGAPERPQTRLYLRDGRIAGAVMIDQGRDTRPVTALIESGAVVEKGLLEDPSVQLRSLNARKAVNA
ncbi:NAD(P)/FAD-dependent oxidoreductase [Poseidonocella sp. HB161398]|uniref:NAD(P)/FAD-dependent oxidoreductase n=1 Tax=Poseidonocella sp. HB161398 TaxID=2320855 RepID=UPI0011094600|nr:FAD-dependent oxidoreductase [Poseidonocella sp. HB161398]